MSDVTKECRKCGEAKALDAFNRCRKLPGGRQARCRACEGIRGRAYRADVPHRTWRKQYYRENKDTIKACTWRNHLRRNYGLTEEQYDALVAHQGNLCAICHLPPRGARKRLGEPRLHVDHNHNTGALRGLLCGLCNQALGMLADDPARMRAAAHYLERIA